MVAMWFAVEPLALQMRVETPFMEVRSRLFALLLTVEPLFGDLG